jgi:hypothetical protein
LVAVFVAQGNAGTEILVRQSGLDTAMFVDLNKLKFTNMFFTQVSKTQLQHFGGKSTNGTNN